MPWVLVGPGGAAASNVLLSLLQKKKRGIPAFPIAHNWRNSTVEKKVISCFFWLMRDNTVRVSTAGFLNTHKYPPVCLF